MQNARIRNLGLIESQGFPILETVGGVTGVGLIVGGLVVKKTAGTVMGVVGATAFLASAVALVMKMASAPSASSPTYVAPPPPPPAPPKPPKLTTQEKVMQYASQYGSQLAPVVNSLFSAIGVQIPGLKGFVRQPALMVVR